jgi:hypothetical protein
LQKFFGIFKRRIKFTNATSEHADARVICSRKRKSDTIQVESYASELISSLAAIMAAGSFTKGIKWLISPLDIAIASKSSEGCCDSVKASAVSTPARS